MRDIENFHTALLWVISLISLFVLGLLLYVIVRFNHRKNPIPSRTTHNTLVEVAWTIVPILILVGISIYSFKLLYFEGDIPKADMTIKATGHQWYWSFEYPDNGDFSFDANLVQQADLKPGQLRLLTTDNPLVVPAGVVVRVQTTSTDVIHSFAVPSFGVKEDAVPGRLNETWFKVDAARRLLRPVLRALRQRPRLHADHGPGGEQGRLRRLGGRRRRRSSPRLTARRRTQVAAVPAN